MPNPRDRIRRGPCFSFGRRGIVRPNFFAILITRDYGGRTQIRVLSPDSYIQTRLPTGTKKSAFLLCSPRFRHITESQPLRGLRQAGDCGRIRKLIGQKLVKFLRLGDINQIFSCLILVFYEVVRYRLKSRGET
jgi:hypothetical protein